MQKEIGNGAEVNLRIDKMFGSAALSIRVDWRDKGFYSCGIFTEGELNKYKDEIGMIEYLITWCKHKYDCLLSAS